MNYSICGDFINKITANKKKETFVDLPQAPNGSNLSQALNGSNLPALNGTNLPQIGFIVTRHVNSEMTNKYWNESVYSIQQNYKDWLWG